MSPLRVGIVGVGTISGQYLQRFPQLPSLELVAVADLDIARAEAVARELGDHEHGVHEHGVHEHGVRAETVDGLIGAPDVDVVLNLTIPAAHAEIGLRAVRAGKHVYGEKPLALSIAEATPLLVAARDAGLRVGSAPDTVLGTGIQTARALIDDGAIGTPVAAAVSWSSPGHELWHPAPAFYYQPGAGPLFDMGPYHLTSLVTFFGPVVRVSGTAGRSARARTIASGDAAGTPIPVAVDTHVSAVLEHASGVTSTVTMSFEVWATRTPLFEVHGTEGTLAVPDPNGFDGTPELATAAAPDRWEPVAPRAGYVDTGRGVGLADMAAAIAEGRPHRASGELAAHVLDVMESILLAGREHRVVTLTTTAARPEPVPLGPPR